MRKTIKILKELRDSDESIEFAENFFDLSDDDKESLRESAKALDDAIKALESSSWIPVSERLPEKKGYFLTSTVFNDVYCDFWNGEEFERTEMILAWMPLPKPYTKEEQS